MGEDGAMGRAEWAAWVGEWDRPGGEGWLAETLLLYIDYSQ